MIKQVLFSITLIVTLAQFLSAQNTSHIFPQVADGRQSDGSYYKTTVTVLPATGSTSVSCFLRLYGLTVTAEGGSTGDVFNFTIPPGGFAIFKTNGDQNIKTGYATLDCTNDVYANLLYSAFAANGTKTAEATVFSSPNWYEHRLIVDQRGGAKFAMAVANHTAVTHTFDVRFVSAAGTTTGSFSLGPRSNLPKFLDELVSAPPGIMGVVTIQSREYSDFAVIGLQFTGSVFTTIPGSDQ